MEAGTPPPAPEAPAAPSGTLTQGDAQTPQIRPGSGPPSAPYVTVTEFDRQDEYRRFLPIFKSLLLFPHWIALMFVFIGALVALVVAWFAVLFTGKFPQGIHKFLTGTYRWSTRVSAYALLMTDKYPPFSLDPDEEYPARFDISYTEEIARWRPLVNWLLVIPYAIVASVLLWLAYICSFLAFWVILFTKQFPQGLFDFNVVAMRWQNRSAVYTDFMTERYPPWTWG
jgi:Domain of unknown function (DUF4389)